MALKLLSAWWCKSDLMESSLRLRLGLMPLFIPPLASEISCNDLFQSSQQSYETLNYILNFKGLPGMHFYHYDFVPFYR